MNDASDIRLDTERKSRIGIDEAIFCESKSVNQIHRIIAASVADDRSLLLTRLMSSQHSQLEAVAEFDLDYDPVSNTCYVGKIASPNSDSDHVAIVTAGTSDVGTAREAARTLHYHGFRYEEFHDVGIAGLWRVLSIKEQLRNMSVVIVAAGMDAALPSVVAGLVSAPVIAVPTSVGYGVAEGGKSALNSILSSCAPGLVTVNIDNGYGAACAAIRILRSVSRL